MADIVYIRELEIETIIGIFDWEREVKQIVSLDLDMACLLYTSPSPRDLP